MVFQRARSFQALPVRSRHHKGGILKLVNGLQTNLWDTVVAVIDKELQHKSGIKQMKKKELSTAVMSLFKVVTMLED